MKIIKQNIIQTLWEKQDEIIESEDIRNFCSLSCKNQWRFRWLYIQKK